MRKIIQYISALLLLLVVGTSCEEGNDNWVIVTEVQPGTYITGDATIYSAVATSSALIEAPLDNAPEGTNVTGIYTWLKSGGSFTILKADAEGNQVTYGKGAVVASTPFETCTLTADAAGFTVAKDGLYYVAVNNADNQLTIIPAEFGIIGDATPGKWDAETVMTQSYDDKKAVVEMTIKDVTLDKKQIKFRYAKTWGVAIPYGSGKVTIHSNMGNATDPKAVIALPESFTSCKGGGENFSLGKVGLYDVTLMVELRSGKFSAKAICTSEDTSSATLPEHMYINGSPFSSDWAWDKAAELTPLQDHSGMFFGIFYFDKNAELKFNHERSWDTGANFGAPDKEPHGYGEYATGGENLKIGASGYYQVVIVSTLSADKKSVINKIILDEVKPYVIGDCAAGGWGAQLAPADMFTLSGKTFESPSLNAGVLRMCVLVKNAAWWEAEFTLKNGAISYRGKNGEDPMKLVNISAGQKVKLDFSAGTGVIE